MSAPTLLTSGNSGAAASVNTASVTPGANLLLCVVFNQWNFHTGSLPTVTGLGLTWTQIDTQTSFFDISRVAVFAASGPGAPGALTIDFGGNTQDGLCWQVFEAVGFDAVMQHGNTQGGSDGAGNATPLITLSSFGNPSNIGFGAVCGYGIATASPGSGATELLNYFLSVNTGLRTETESSAPADNTVDWSMSGLPVGYADSYCAVAMELRAVPLPFVMSSVS